MYEELKPKLNILASSYLIVGERDEREERSNNSSGRLTDIWPADDNEYEPIQSPVCSSLAQHDNIFNLKLLHNMIWFEAKTII